MIIMGIMYILSAFCAIIGQAIGFSFMALFGWVSTLCCKEEPKQEDEIPTYVYSELEAYRHQLMANYRLGERVIHDIKQQEFVGRLSPTDREKYDKKLADYEARCAQIEKKIVKLGEKYNIDIE